MSMELRSNALEKTHGALLEENYTMPQARRSVFWPGITSDINTLIMGFETCQVNNTSQQMELMKGLDITSPYHTTALDLF